MRERCTSGFGWRWVAHRLPVAGNLLPVSHAGMALHAPIRGPIKADSSFAGHEDRADPAPVNVVDHLL